MRGEFKKTFAAVVTVGLLTTSAWANGSFHGFSHFEKVKGRPDLGMVQLYEYKAFLTPDGNGTGFSYHCGDPGTCPEPYTGCMWWPSVPPGRYSLLSVFPDFFPRGKVVTDILIISGQRTERNADQPLDFSAYYTKEQWDPIGAAVILQTFLATGVSVSRISFAKADDNRQGSIRMSVHRDNGGLIENWPQVGPERVVGRQGYGGDHWAAWNSGDVPLTPGTMYAVRLEAVNGPNIQPYWCDDSFYPYGRGYRATQSAPVNRDYFMAVFTDNDGTLATMQARDWDSGILAGATFYDRWAQSYQARGSSLAGAAVRATIGGGSGGWNFPLRISVHAGAPDGPQVGPVKTMPNAFAPYIGQSGVSYNPGEVPTTFGQTYWIVYQRPDGSGFNVTRQRDGNTYPHGTAAYRAQGVWVMQQYDLYMHIYEYGSGITPLPTLTFTPSPTHTPTVTPTFTPSNTPFSKQHIEVR